MSKNELKVVTQFATDFLTVDQIKEFISKIPELDIYSHDIYNRKPLPPESFQLYVRTIYDGALRAGEGRQILVQDLDLKYARINLPRTKSGWDWCKCSKHEKGKLISTDSGCKKCKGKGKLRRRQSTSISEPLAIELHNFVEKYHLGKKNYLFNSPSFPKQPISRDWIWKSIRQVGKLCSFEIFGERDKKIMKYVYTHLFRRSRAMQMDQDGARIGVIARKLRHRNIKDTMRYIRASVADLQKWEKDNGTWF